MIEDKRIVIGYGFYLDWRWRQALKRLSYVEDASTAEEFFAGPDEDVLLADVCMTDYVFPYLKFRMQNVRLACLKRRSPRISPWLRRRSAAFLHHHD